MKRFFFSLTIPTAIILCLLSIGSVQAEETTVENGVNAQGQPVIITTVPAPKEVVVEPQGYVNCFVVPSGWNYHNVWVAQHKVCQYSPNNGAATQGVAWVDGYWGCTKYNNAQNPQQGECTNWQWQPGHWVKTLEVY